MQMGRKSKWILGNTQLNSGTQARVDDHFQDMRKAPGAGTSVSIRKNENKTKNQDSVKTGKEGCDNLLCCERIILFTVTELQDHTTVNMATQLRQLSSWGSAV